MSTERWRQIVGFPDYDVSDAGRVRSWKGASAKAKIMKVRLGVRDGYPRVTLQNSKSGKKVVRVHMLVARAFLGPARGRLVRHKDGNKEHARLTNLEYGTYMDNKLDKHRHGTDQVGERNSQSELIREHAKQIYKLRGKMAQSEVADRFGISRQAVSDIQRGITWAKTTGANR